MYRLLDEYVDWDQELKYVDLETGIRMAYIEAGNPEKKPLLFLHGHTDTSRSFKISGTVLEHDFHIFVLELRGYGHTDKPDVFAYSTMEMAHDVIAFMKEMELSEVYLSGFSMGSFVAQAVAFSIPDQIIKMVLISTGARMPESAEDVKTVVNDLTDVFSSEKDERFIASWIPTYRQFDDAMLRYYWENLKKLPIQSYVAGWLALSLTDHRNFLQFIKAPVKILWGKNDSLFTKDCQLEIRRLLPGAEFREMNTTHEMLGEAPIAVGQEIKEFFLQ